VTEAAHPPSARRSPGNLLRRVLAAVVALPCLIIITERGDLHFLFMVGLIIFTGMLEFYRLLEQKGFAPAKTVGIGCGLVIAWYAYFRAGMYVNFLLAFALLLLMTVELLRRGVEKAVVHIASTVLGVLYVGWLGSHFVLLRELPRLGGLPYDRGADFVLLGVLLTWSCDTGAYVVGRSIGRTPLFPRVSPKKSREGALGGIVFALAAGWVAHLTFADYLGSNAALALGAVAALAGITGDLVESLIKRDLDVKDTAQLIPGHGGTLDRFDSLFFSMPLIYYFHKFFVI
jgi:phosphatidate cytidylyltransferase